ncbi:putative RNA-binding protein with TRAM domain [Arthrobacter sp. GAS37]
MANSITAPLAQGKDAIVKLDDTTGQGDGMRLADIHCL